MGLANIIINDQGQRALSVSWTFTGEGATVTLASWYVLGPIVMCVYIVPKEGEERRSRSSNFFAK